MQDGHVRRYMTDGRVLPREWSAERTRDSQALFDQRGVGIWLARARRDDELVGFCGFARLPSLPEPQLLYAMLERFAGRGLATEMARACIAQARAQPGFDAILADVDAVNAASVRVLQKLGFERIAVTQGAFGDVFVFRLGLRPSSAEPSDQGIRWGASSTRRPSAADT